MSAQNEAREIWEALKPNIRKFIQAEIKNCVKTAPAIVQTADNTNHTAVVQQPYSGETLELFNCTGKTLLAGDSVIVMWFGGQTNAWIGIKNDGEPWNT